MTGNQMIDYARKQIASRQACRTEPLTRGEKCDLLAEETQWAFPSINAIVDKLESES